MSGTIIEKVHEDYRDEFKLVKFISVSATPAGNYIQARFRLGPSKRTVRARFSINFLKIIEKRHSFTNLGVIENRRDLRSLINFSFFDPIKRRIRSKQKIHIPDPSFDENHPDFNALHGEYDKAVLAALKEYKSGSAQKIGDRHKRIRWKKFMHEAVVTCLQHGASKDELEEVFKEALVEHVINS